MSEGRARGRSERGGGKGDRGGKGAKVSRAARGIRDTRPAQAQAKVKAKPGAVARDLGPAGPIGGKQRRYLRGLGHGLTAVVLVGKEGVTEGLGGALEVALEQHELIKVKLGQNAPEDRHVTAEAMAKLTRSALVQVLGSTVLLYRRHPTEPKIVLPR